MSQNKFRIYRFHLYNLPEVQQQLPFEQSPEAVIQSLITSSQSISNLTENIVATTSNSSYQNTTRSISIQNENIDQDLDSTNLCEGEIIPIPLWRPSTCLHNLHTHFQKTILYQH